MQKDTLAALIILAHPSTFLNLTLQMFLRVQSENVIICVSLESCMADYWAACTAQSNSVFGRWCQKRSSREGKTRGSGTKKRRSHKWFHMIFSCTDPCKDPCTDTFCTSSPLPLKNPQGIANLKKAICVVQRDSIMGVTL